VHRLIALHYIHNPDPNTLTFVNHINHIRTDNTIDNLEWVSPTQNSQDKGFRGHGTPVTIYNEREFWEQCPHAVVVEDHNGIEFTNLFYDPDEESFYVMMEWNQMYYKRTTYLRNGMSFVSVLDANGQKRQIYFRTFHREYNQT
jgi:hypothetical protein